MNYGYVVKRSCANLHNFLETSLDSTIAYGLNCAMFYFKMDNSGHETF